MNLICIENKAAKLKLNDIVMQPVMDKLISEISKVFGANAAEKGEYTGELTNCFENAADTLDIEIHSPGGSVMDGYVLYNELNKLRARGVFVTAHINTLAASMASVIAMAADKITMAKGGQMMIHEVSQGVRGNAEELAKAAKMCDEMSQEIAEIYAARSGKPVSEMREKMRAETWFNAKDALAIGLIDEIFDIRAEKSKPTGMSLLSKLFPENSEVSKIEAALAEADSLRADISAKDSIISNLTAEITAKDHTIIENASALAARDLNIANLTESIRQKDESIAESEAKIAALEKDVADAKASSGQQAIELLASAGQEAPLAEVGNSPIQVDLLAQYAALQGQAKRDFLAKHGPELQSLAKAKG